MKYILVFHPPGCTENVHSKLLLAILVNPVRVFSTMPATQTKKPPQGWIRCLVEMAGIIRLIPETHPFGAVQITHVKIRSRRIFEPVSVLNPTPDQPIKKANRKTADLLYWWRWRELNPRPQALRHRLYMLISSISLTLYYPTSRENTERFWISFNESTPEMLHHDLI